MSNLFDVDIVGFKQTLVGDAARILCEPVSNALDTDATEVSVGVNWARGTLTYRITDNDETGFESLAEAWTLFAPSRRRHLADKRGRFGFGEKEFIALIHPGTVTIESTAGKVSFVKDKRVVSKSKRAEGSMVEAVFRAPRTDAEELVARLRTIVVPEGVIFRLFADLGGHGPSKGPGLTGGVVIEPRKPVASFEATLPTVNVDAEGNLRPSRRTARVDLLEPLDGELPHIYELGMPVVPTDFPYSVNVHQKVVLNKDRDNVPPAYLRQLREHVLNNTHNLLGKEEAKSAWVTEALPGATPEALRTVVEAIHGKNAVIADPSNLEATKTAVEQGRVVVHGRQFTPATWKVIRQHGILKPAGKVIATEPTASPEGKPPIPKEGWTEEMQALADYTRAVAAHLIGRECAVEFHSLRSVPTNAGTSGHYLAWWGGGTLTFNLGRLGKAWPEKASQEEVDAILIHELAHSRAADHMSAAFYDACCQLGARLRSLPAQLR